MNSKRALPIAAGVAVIVVVCICLLAGLLVLSQVLGGPERAIVGRWEHIEGADTIEFFRDGTLVSQGAMGLTTTGDYEFVDDAHIRLQVSGLWSIAGSQVLEVDVSGTRLVLVDSYGNTYEYRRVD